MTKRSIILAALALLSFTSAPALAQSANKTWVSSASGNDTGTCQFVSPCKTFAYAITQTAAGGELDVKDSGSYGVVTITKAISIVSVGALAAIAVPSGATAITVNAGSSDGVVLQGLVIDGHGVGSNGIVSNTAGSLTVIDCHIRNVADSGIAIYMSGAAFSISGTEVSHAQTGIVTENLSGSLKNVNLHDNSMQGIAVSAGNVMLTDSLINHNSTYGIYASTYGDIIIGNTAVANNGTGIYILPNNGPGPVTVGSYGNNYINQNGTDISGTLAKVSPQ